MIILPGPASQELANQLAIGLNARIVPVFSKKFPDGESYIRIDGEIKGEDVVVVQTTSPPQDERMIQLFMMTSTAKDLGAKRIVAVVPYFAYSRQDQIFIPGEAFSAKITIHMLKACGVTRIITVNSHNPKGLRAFALPIEDVSAISLLAEHFKEKGLKGAVSISMGKKGLLVAEEAAKTLKGPFTYIPTSRDRHTGNVRIEEKRLDLKGKIAILFDDIISSGGTMSKAVAHTKNEGAKRVYVACVHPLLIGDARVRILQSGADAVIGTDTVPGDVSIVSVAPALAKALRS